jgi:INO80 complex subunit C
VEPELPFKNPNFKRSKEKNFKQILLFEKTIEGEPDNLDFLRIGALPSLKPKKKYCDLSGLVAIYTDPKTLLHYFNATYYHKIQQLSDDQVKKYLELRNAHNPRYGT